MLTKERKDIYGLRVDYKVSIQVSRTVTRFYKGVTELVIGVTLWMRDEKDENRS